MDGFLSAFMASSDTNTKKRKVDKDGFVCPSTSDIPRSSNHYPGSYDVNSEEGGLSSLPETNTDCNVTYEREDSVSSYFQQGQDDQASTIYNDNSQPEPLPTGHGAANQFSEEETSVMQTLVNEFTKDTSQLFEEWSTVLRQSEDFEMECPNKLDKLIQEAQDLESRLSEQKTALCQRLKGLGQTLKQDLE